MLSNQIAIALSISLFFAFRSTIHNESFIYDDDIGISVINQITNNFFTDIAGYYIVYFSK